VDEGCVEGGGGLEGDGAAGFGAEHDGSHGKEVLVWGIGSG
jgi:hypothetical protein